MTNWNLFKNRLQTVIEFHNQRGNAENFIKEQKWAYDLLHFPMQKLHANHAYGLLAMVAHNLLRTIALLDNRKHPLFAKKLRRKYIHIPGKNDPNHRQAVDPNPGILSKGGATDHHRVGRNANHCLGPGWLATRASSFLDNLFMTEGRPRG